MWWGNLPCFHATPSRLAKARLLDVTWKHPAKQVLHFLSLLAFTYSTTFVNPSFRSVMNGMSELDIVAYSTTFVKPSFRSRVEAPSFHNLNTKRKKQGTLPFGPSSWRQENDRKRLHLRLCKRFLNYGLKIFPFVIARSFRDATASRNTYHLVSDENKCFQYCTSWDPEPAIVILF